MIQSDDHIAAANELVQAHRDNLQFNAASVSGTIISVNSDGSGLMQTEGGAAQIPFGVPPNGLNPTVGMSGRFAQARGSSSGGPLQLAELNPQDAGNQQAAGANLPPLVVRSIADTIDDPTLLLVTIRAVAELVEESKLPSQYVMAVLPASQYATNPNPANWPQTVISHPSPRTVHLAAAITSGATSLTSVESMAGWPAADTVTIDGEVLSYSNRTNPNTMPNLVRGIGGTTAAAYSAQAIVRDMRHALTTINQGGGIGSSDTTIPVTSTTGFSGIGGIQIDAEKILTGAISGNSFTGCTRAYQNTSAAAHANGASVLQTIPTLLIAGPSYQANLQYYVTLSYLAPVGGQQVRSAWTDVATVGPLTLPPPPAVPTGLAGQWSDVRTINVTWLAPTGADRYRVRLYQDATLLDTIPTTALNLILTSTSGYNINAFDGHTYTVQVSAGNSWLSYSLYSAAATVAPAANALPTPTMNSAVWDDAGHSDVKANAVANTGSPRSYRYKFYIGGVLQGSVDKQFDDDIRCINTVLGAYNPASAYTVTCTMVDIWGREGTPSGTMSVTAALPNVPGTPTAQVLSDGGGLSMIVPAATDNTISWTWKIIRDSDAPQYWTSNSISTIYRFGPGNMIPPAVRYTVAVAANNFAGQSTYTTPAVNATPDTTAPAPPTGLTMSAMAYGLQLNWTKNTEIDMAGYELQVRRDATTLNGAITALVTTVPVASVTGYPSGGGTLLVDTEQITYTGILGSSFTGCTRGANGTTAASHLNGVAIGYMVSDYTVAGNATGDFLTLPRVPGSHSYDYRMAAYDQATPRNQSAWTAYFPGSPILSDQGAGAITDINAAASGLIAHVALADNATTSVTTSGIANTLAAAQSVTTAYSGRGLAIDAVASTIANTAGASTSIVNALTTGSGVVPTAASSNAVANTLAAANSIEAAMTGRKLLDVSAVTDGFASPRLATGVNPGNDVVTALTNATTTGTAATLTSGSTNDISGVTGLANVTSRLNAAAGLNSTALNLASVTTGLNTGGATTKLLNTGERPEGKLQNTDFEQWSNGTGADPDYWTSAGTLSGHATQDTTNIHSGSFSAKVVGGSTLTLTSAKVNVSSAEIYALGAWAISVTSGGGIGVTVSILWYNSSGTLLSTVTSTTLVASNTSWQRCIILAAAPSTAVTAAIQLSGPSGSWDSVDFRLAPGGERLNNDMRVPAGYTATYGTNDPQNPQDVTISTAAGGGNVNLNPKSTYQLLYNSKPIFIPRTSRTRTPTASLSNATTTSTTLALMTSQTVNLPRNATYPLWATVAYRAHVGINAGGGELSIVDANGAQYGAQSVLKTAGDKIPVQFYEMIPVAAGSGSGKAQIYGQVDVAGTDTLTIYSDPSIGKGLYVPSWTVNYGLYNTDFALNSKAWFKMAETLGTTALDSGPNAYSSGTYNSATVNQAGVPMEYVTSTSVLLSGLAASYTSIPHQTAYNMDSTQGDFTILLSVKPISLFTNGSRSTLLCKAAANGTSNGWWFFVGNGTNFLELDFTSSSVLLSGATVIGTGSWLHIALTRSVNTYTSYINGVQDGTNTNAAVVTATTAPLIIGADNTTATNGNNMNADFQNLAFLNYAMTKEEVQCAYQANH